MKEYVHRILAFFIVITTSFINGHAENFAFPQFKKSMLRDTSNEAQVLNRDRLFESANPKFVQMFQDIYERSMCELDNPSNDSYRIPPIVHQIWLGSPVPEKYKRWMESWAGIEGWKYILWTDKEVASLSMRNRDLYDNSKNFGEKADILRLELLHKFGGLYVDTDFECVNPALFDRFNKCFDFYIGFEPLEHGIIGKFNMFKMCNALMAAIPGHPLLKDLIENLKANYLAYKRHTGPIGTTGPSYVSRIICEYVESNVDAYRNLFLPSTFFYPFSVIDVRNYRVGTEDVLPIFQETLGIHYWNMSWIVPDDATPATSKEHYKEKHFFFPKLELKNGIF
jgi:inositol phosphorylceramide mannosyltransferase catalytic subunit